MRRAKRVLDWDAARRRLAQSAEKRTLDPAQIEGELQRRAAALAGNAAAHASAARTIELISFALGSQRCALETRAVFEVRRPCELTRLPGAPAHLLGVTNLRGEILPLFDLAQLFGTGRADGAERARTLVLGEFEPELGVHADEVFGVVNLPMSEVLDAGDAHIDTPLRWLHGVTRDALVVLNAEALLADELLRIGERDERSSGRGAAQ
jgi:purine-binding chemotaxis protein CheW